MTFSSYANAAVFIAAVEKKKKNLLYSKFVFIKSAEECVIFLLDLNILHFFSVAYGGDLKVSLVHWFPMSGVTLLKGHTINLWSHDMINGRWQKKTSCVTPLFTRDPDNLTSFGPSLAYSMLVC